MKKTTLMLVFAAIGLLTIFIAYSVTVSPAQDATGKWILGAWEGAHGPATYVRSDSSRFEFREENGKIRWTMVRSSTLANVYSQGPQEYEASGAVSKITDSSVEFEGAYDKATSFQTVGSPLKYSLTKKGESLEGFGIGKSNFAFTVVLKRAR